MRWNVDRGIDAGEENYGIYDFLRLNRIKKLNESNAELLSGQSLENFVYIDTAGNLEEFGIRYALNSIFPAESINENDDDGALAEEANNEEPGNILSDEQIDDYLSEQVLPPIMEYAGNDDDGDDEPGGTWVKDVPTPVVLMCVLLHRLTHILDSNKRRNRLISGHVRAAF